MSRAAIVEIVRNVVADIPVYGTNAIDTPEADRFCIVRFEEKTQAFGLHGTNRVSIWVHDRDRSYDVIDEKLDEIKDALTSAVHVPGADGYTLTQANWRGDSVDLYDDGFRTCTRNSGYDYVSRKTA